MRAINIIFVSSFFMAKRHGGDSIHGIEVKVKKRKGVKVRTVNVPESDDEAPPPNVDTEYARLLKTRVATSGKADSVTMNTLRLNEVKDTTHSDALELAPNTCDESIADNTIPGMPAKKPRKKMNDSVRYTVFTKPSSHADHPSDQDANLVERTIYCPRRDGHP